MIKTRLPLNLFNLNGLSLLQKKILLKLDVLRFHRQRSDYYEYLADLIEGIQGRRTLRDLFDDDAHRYGSATVRGRLTKHWSQRYEESGGDLCTAWSKTLPHDEVQLLRIAQSAGAGALPATLRDLARAARLIEQARITLIVTLFAGCVAIGVLMILLGAIPFFTVPKLQQTFQLVPPNFYGSLTKSLFGFAQILRQFLFIFLVLIGAASCVIAWSLPYLTGRLRSQLDQWIIWRIYREFHSIRFLAMLAILVRQRRNVDTRLREALIAQGQGARPWMASHIEDMVQRIDSGLVGGDIFDTGLIDRETWWFMTDVIAAQGMEIGMLHARTRVEQRILPRIRFQAAFLRWILLLGAVAAILGLGLWHYGVIDELRRAMINYYAH